MSGLRKTADEVEILSAPAASTSAAAWTDEMPPPIVKGTVTASATLRTVSSIVLRPSTVAVMSSMASSSAPAAQYALQHSTGSPASLMSTKFTPLTTRPLIMSMHGMITKGLLLLIDSTPIQRKIDLILYHFLLMLRGATFPLPLLSSQPTIAFLQYMRETSTSRTAFEPAGISYSSSMSQGKR